MQGKIYKIVKILGRMNSRTVMMERFQDADFSWHCCPQKTTAIPRSACVLYLLFTQPSLIRSFHSSDPCFSVSCPKGVGYARVYCTLVGAEDDLIQLLKELADSSSSSTSVVVYCTAVLSYPASCSFSAMYLFFSPDFYEGRYFIV